MPDRRKRAQLLQELETLRQRIAELEQKEAQRQGEQTTLQEAKDQYRNLFTYSGESIFVVDPNTLTFVDVNANAARRLGYSREELCKMALRDVEIYDPDDNANALSWESVASGTIFYECLYRRKNGDEIPVEVSSRLARFGDRYLLLNFVRDITRRKEMENALLEYQHQLEEQNEELRAFSHTVAHDLKTPLSSIIGYGDLLQQRYATMPPEKLGQLLSTIVQTGYRMNNIVDELLLLSGVRDTEVEMAPLDMADIVSSALQRLAFMIRKQQAVIVLPDVWPTALGHGPWVEEVWVNYLSNAIKYGGQPPRVELGATAHENARLRFWVADNGAGLAPEEQAKLFAPFERLHQVRIQGHGLGLSIVHRIVEKLGGQVGVRSPVPPELRSSSAGEEDGHGCAFYFALPSAEREERD
jgi:PAS domain S-box-containing protein